MFGLRPRRRPSATLDPGFVENYPFTTLIEHGWSVQDATAAHIRRKLHGPVHTVSFTHPHGHTAIFDITPAGRMSKHATYTVATHPGEPAHLFFAHTADAAAALAAEALRETDQLATIPGVQQLR